MRGILPLLGALILLGCLIYNLWHYWNPAHSYTTWTLPFAPRWQIGGVFLLDVGALLIGVVLMFTYRALRPAFFRREVLNRDTPTGTPMSSGTRVGVSRLRTSPRKKAGRMAWYRT